MEFTSQICTTKIQSERLLVLGLKKETADMYLLIDHFGNYQPATLCDFMFSKDQTTPAWSLHRLIEILNNWGIDFSIKGKADPYEYVISIIEGHVIKKAIDRVLRIMEEE